MKKLARAMVLVADRTLELRELPVPDRPPPGGALLTVEGCGMCGSDVEQYEGAVVRKGMMSYPCIPGHETVGRIAAMDDEGARRWGLKIGDRVSVSAIPPCGACPGCRRGAGCVDAFYYGFRDLDIGSGLWGGYSEMMEIAPRTRLTPISDKVSIQDALLFNPLAGGFDWVFKQANVGLGDDVLITGGGQRGLASVIAAREAGASTIIITGLRRDGFKLELAKTFGATHTLVVEDCDVQAEVMRITGGRGVNKVIETTPLAFQPIHDAIAVSRMGGVIVIGGIKGFVPMPDFPIDAVSHKRLHIVGALSTSEWAVQQAIRVIESGRYPLHLMHTHSVPLEGAEHAIHMLAGEIPQESPLHISILPGMSA